MKRKFQRKTIKRQAKQLLRGKWILAALVGIIVLMEVFETVLPLTLEYSQGRIRIGLEPPWAIADQSIELFRLESLQKLAEGVFTSLYRGGGSVGRFFIQQMDSVTPVITIPFWITLGLLALALQIFILSPLSLGGTRFFMYNRAGRSDEFKLEDLFWAFRSPHYRNIIWVMFRRNVIILLWVIPLIFPAILVSLELSQIPYILNETPDLPAPQVHQKSKALTQGSKGSIFLLDLSFIGWYILAHFSFGLLKPFVAAYQAQVYAVLYNQLKEPSVMT